MKIEKNLLTKYLRNLFSAVSIFSYGTDFIDLLNKALFKKLMQGSPSTLPDPNVQSKLTKGKTVCDP